MIYAYANPRLTSPFQRFNCLCAGDENESNTKRYSWAYEFLTDYPQKLTMGIFQIVCMFEFLPKLSLDFMISYNLLHNFNWIFQPWKLTEQITHNITVS